MKVCLKLICISAFFLFPALTFGAQDIYYVTQTGGELSYGDITISNAWSVSDFNNPSNWSSNDQQDKIDPGDMVYFSGTITSTIDIKGSGSSGKYITFDGTDAQINVNVIQIDTRGVIHAVNKNYLKFQNFKMDGKMENGDVSRSGICIKSRSGSSDHIIIDNVDITRTGSGIWLWGNIGNVTITNSNLHELSGSGLRGSVLVGEADAPHNIVFGGSSRNGNTVKNAGYLDSHYNVDGDIQIDQGDDIIVSYNHLYSDTVNWGMAGLYLNECRNVLVEYNTIHDHTADHHRSGINFKDDQTSRKTGYAIVRYNKIYNELSDEKSWGSSSVGIRVGYNTEHFYVYGNYIKNCGSGVNLNISWSSKYYDDGINSEHLYVFSNVITSTQQAGIRIEGPAGSDYDSMSNIYIFNNTVYNSATFDYTQAYIDQGHSSFDNDSGIYSNFADAQTIGFHVKNNVIINSRPTKSDYIQIHLRKQSDLYMNNQHYYHYGGESSLRYISSTNTTLTWNNVALPFGYGSHDTEGNPLLSDSANGDFTISSPDSPLINSAIDMGDGVINKIAIHGTHYPVEWATALAPNTDWSTIPPTIVVAKQDLHGSSWEKGAYVYIQEYILKKPGSLLPPSTFRKVQTMTKSQTLF